MNETLRKQLEKGLEQAQGITILSLEETEDGFMARMKTVRGGQEFPVYLSLESFSGQTAKPAEDISLDLQLRSFLDAPDFHLPESVLMQIANSINNTNNGVVVCLNPDGGYAVRMRRFEVLPNLKDPVCQIIQETDYFNDRMEEIMQTVLDMESWFNQQGLGPNPKKSLKV